MTTTQPIDNQAAKAEKGSVAPKRVRETGKDGDLKWKAQVERALKHMGADSKAGKIL